MEYAEYGSKVGKLVVYFHGAPQFANSNSGDSDFNST